MNPNDFNQIFIQQLDKWNALAKFYGVSTPEQAIDFYYNGLALTEHHFSPVLKSFGMTTTRIADRFATLPLSDQQIILRLLS
jgi:hypothetical protein